MDRLTMTSDKGRLAFTFDLDVTCDKSEIEKIVKLGERLKAYEDTEIEPEEIERLKTNLGKCVCTGCWLKEEKKVANRIIQLENKIIQLESVLEQAAKELENCYGQEIELTTRIWEIIG